MMLTYAVGDIHGSLDKFKSLLDACREHADGRPMQFVFLGDYIDRGPDSAGVLRLMMRLQSELQDRAIALKGNHEAFVIGILDGTMSAATWLRFGGTQTLSSYGVSNVAALPHVHLDWMRRLPLSYDDGRRFFVHAGVDPTKPLTKQTEQDLLWIRQPFLDSESDYGRLIVHGHTPLETGAPDLRRNRLNLDTGAVFGGPLTAAIFDDTRTEPLGYVQARDEPSPE